MREVVAESLVHAAPPEHLHEPGGEDVAQIATRGVPIGAIVRDRPNPLGVLTLCSRHLDHCITEELRGAKTSPCDRDGAHGAHLHMDEPSGGDLTGRGKKSVRWIIKEPRKEPSTRRAFRAVGARHTR